MNCAIQSCGAPTGKGVFCARCFDLLNPGLRKTVVFLNGADIRRRRPGFDEALTHAVAQIEQRLRDGVLHPDVAWPFRKQPKGERR